MSFPFDTVSSPEEDFAPNRVTIKKYASIWLERDFNLEPHALFCMNCQNTLGVYQGNVLKVLPGEHTAIMSFPFEIRCKGKSQIHGRCPYYWIISGFINQ